MKKVILYGTADRTQAPERNTSKRVDKVETHHNCRGKGRREGAALFEGREAVNGG